MRPRMLSELNKHFVNKNIEWTKGVLDAANFLNYNYSRQTKYKYLLGDCLLAKLNLLKKSDRIRLNPYYVTSVK